MARLQYFFLNIFHKKSRLYYIFLVLGPFAMVRCVDEVPQMVSFVGVENARFMFYGIKSARSFSYFIRFFYTKDAKIRIFFTKNTFFHICLLPVEIIQLYLSASIFGRKDSNKL